MEEEAERQRERQIQKIGRRTMKFFRALHSYCNYDFTQANCHWPAQDYACQLSDRSWEGIHGVVFLPSKLSAIYGLCGKETCFL